MNRFLLANGRPLVSSGGLVSFAPGAPPGGGEEQPPPESGTTSITLTPFVTNGTAARFNIQHRAGTEAANVPVVCAYTGEPPAVVQMRVIDAGGATVPGADWATLAGLTVDPATSTVTGYLPGVRLGVDYRRQVRVGTSATVTDTDARRWSVGPNMQPTGQSNMVGGLTSSLYSDTVPGKGVTELAYWRDQGASGFWGVNGWVSPGGISGAGTTASMGSDATATHGGNLRLGRLVGDMLAAQHGRKVGLGINAWAFGQHSLSRFLPDGDKHFIFTNSGTTFGTTSSPGNVGLKSPVEYGFGDYQVVQFHQGEANVNQPLDERLAEMIAMAKVHHAAVAPYGRSPAQLTILVAVLGSYGIGSNGSPTAANIETIRRAAYAFVEYGQSQGWDVRIGWNCIDLPPGADGLHMDPATAKVSLARMAQSTAHAVGAAPFSAAGPRLTRAYTRSGNTVTFAVEGVVAGLEAKSAALPITGWYANTAEDFSGMDLTVSAVEVLPGAVRITVQGAPSTFYVKHLGGKIGTAQSYAPDTSNVIIDKVVYPTGAHPGEQHTGLPLQDTPVAIKVGA